jgi:hypothetical protein
MKLFGTPRTRLMRIICTPGVCYFAREAIQRAVAVAGD